MVNKPEMEFNMGPYSRTGLPGILVICVALFAGTMLHTPAAPAQTGGPSPDLTIGAERYPDDDAVILRLEQYWTLDRDGTAARRVHKWIKLFNSRPIRREADPRIDFEAGREKVEFHVARSHLPNGEIVDVPDYSYNKTAPNDVGGWPEYADWEQWIISFSGIEDDVVLELDYEITTAPGVMPWVDADIRLHEDYPVVERVVTVTLPRNATLHHRLDRVPPEHSESDKVSGGDSVTYRWTFTDLPSDRGERQSPPWRERSGRLRFTTVQSPAAWVSAMLDAIGRSAEAGDRLKACVDATIENETDPAERARKIAAKIRAGFNFIDSPKALRSVACRGAEEVFRSNHGNSLEAAALLLAALRSAGAQAEPQLAVDAAAWDEGVPTGSAFEAVVLSVRLPDGTIHLHPQEGEFRDPGTWGRRILLTVADGGDLNQTYIFARGERRPSELNVTGQLKLQPGGEAEGELRVQLTGLFYDPLELATAGAQKKFVTRLASRVLSDFEVSGHSITALSDDVLRATVDLSRKEPLERVGAGRVLQFADGPAFLKDVPMPLDRSYRRTDVRLAGPFRERVDLVVQMPDGWSPSILPAAPDRVDGRWGYVEQKASHDGDTIRLYRDIVILDETMSPGDFDALRRAVNDLRASKSLLAMFEPAGDEGKGY